MSAAPRPVEGLLVVAEHFELPFDAPSEAPGRPATKPSQMPTRRGSAPAGDNQRTGATKPAHRGRQTLAMRRVVVVSVAGNLRGWRKRRSSDGEPAAGT